VSTPRRTQAERSASTQALLVEAAIDSLVEHGWAATTSVEVCARAGVTRGAFTHHFPSLPALLAAALQSLYDEVAANAPRPASSLVEFVDGVWATISPPRFKAMLEAWLAMANDPALGEDLGPVVLRFATLVSPERLEPEHTDTHRPPAGASGADRHAFCLLARETMLGLVLGRATNGGRPLGHERLVLDVLRERARELDAPAGA